MIIETVIYSRNEKIKKMDKEQILIYLNPDYRKCRRCSKYYNPTDTEKLLCRVLHGNPLKNGFNKTLFCFMCGWNHIYLKNLLDSRSIPIKEIEKTYGDYYDITFQRKLFSITKRKQ